MDFLTIQRFLYRFNTNSYRLTKHHSDDEIPYFEAVDNIIMRELAKAQNPSKRKNTGHDSITKTQFKSDYGRLEKL